MNSVKKRGRKLLAAASRFFSFFLLMCFVITCCMVLFLNTLEDQLLLSRQNIRQAAVVTFLNVIVLSLLCSVIDLLRRRYMVDRPVKRIVQAAQRIMDGDLSARVEKQPSLDPNDSFNIIIDYFNRMAQELSGMETLRTDFIANVSHELKTPLAVMQNYGTMLQQPGLSEEQRIAYAKAITDASRGLASMVGNILKLNKLENQTIYPDVQTYDLGEQLCQCLVDMEEVWERKQLCIEVDVEENVRVTTDPELLVLVWNNLLSNAIKFTQPGGQVRVSLKTQGQDAVVTVSDTGCGIRPEVGKHIFEKFYQGDTSHATRGNGLGLALVKRVMDITGADISVTSETGKGSAFTVKLKRAGNGTT